MSFGSSFGVGFFYMLLLPFLALIVWAVMDALLRPDSDWAAADQNKTAWVIALLGGPVIVFPVGIMVSLVYLFGLRTRLARVARGYTPTTRVPGA